jgi:prophage regulatory protein
MKPVTPTRGRRLVPIAKVLDRTSISRTELYRMLARGDFPKAVSLPGGKKRFWFEDEIDQWMEKLR